MDGRGVVEDGPPPYEKAGRGTIGEAPPLIKKKMVGVLWVHPPHRTDGGMLLATGGGLIKKRWAGYCVRRGTSPIERMFGVMFATGGGPHRTDGRDIVGDGVTRSSNGWVG